MKRFIIFLSMAACILFITGCGMVDVSGTWNGTITQTHPEGDTGPIQLTIDQDGEDLTGEVIIAGVITLDFTGTLDGDKVSGTCVNVENSEDTTEIEATVNGDEMTGTWENISDVGGTFEVTRE